MIDIHLDSEADPFEHLRGMVEAGEPDGPAAVYRNGARSVLLGSIHRACVLSTAGTQFIVWRPGPKDAVGPIVGRLLDEAREAIDERKKERLRIASIAHPFRDPAPAPRRAARTKEGAG